MTDEADRRFFEIAERHGLTLRRYIDGEKFVDAKIVAALREAATIGKPDPATISLIVDACVAIENFLYPDLADKRCDPAAVNTRLLAWIDEFVMEPEAERIAPAERCTGCTMAELGTCYCNEQRKTAP